MYTAVVPSFSPFFASRVTSSAKTSRAASIGPICALQQQDSQIEVPSNRGQSAILSHSDMQSVLWRQRLSMQYETKRPLGPNAGDIVVSTAPSRRR